MSRTSDLSQASWYRKAAKNKGGRRLARVYAKFFSANFQLTRFHQASTYSGRALR